MPREYISYDIQEESEEPKAKFLISVEGEVLEKEYFRAIVQKYQHKLICELIVSPARNDAGYSSDPLGVFNRLNEKKSEIETLNNKDQFWMVLDVDGHANLQKAIDLAKENEYKVALNNRCFEVWLCMHFREWSGNKCMTCCPKNSSDCKKCYSLLKEGNSIKDLLRGSHVAIRKAKELNVNHENEDIPVKPNSRMYLLMEAIGLM